MNQLLEWSPLIVFFVVFKLKGIYWATGSLMVVCTAVMLVHRFRAGRFKPMHVITVAVLLVLGSATLFLHDKRFIQMKPTVLLALTAALFLGSTVGFNWMKRLPCRKIVAEPSTSKMATVMTCMGLKLPARKRCTSMTAVQTTMSAPVAQ